MEPLSPNDGIWNETKSDRGYEMLLQDRTCMEELFASLGKPLAKLYEEDEMNIAINYALSLEENEQEILTGKKYTLSDILYGRYYWFTEFLVQYEKLYGKDAGMEQQQFILTVTKTC